jgi:hypothetical protein
MGTFTDKIIDEDTLLIALSRETDGCILMTVKINGAVYCRDKFVFSDTTTGHVLGVVRERLEEYPECAEA